MRTIAQIIDRYRPDARGDEWKIEIKNAPHQDLVIAGLGKSPDGGELVSVTSITRNGALVLRDPEIVFAVYRANIREAGQSNSGSFENALWLAAEWTSDLQAEAACLLTWGDDNRAKVLEAVKRVEVSSFAEHWSEELRRRGFLRVAPEGVPA